MKLSRIPILWGVTLTIMSTASGQGSPAACGAPEHRQFDFWIGDWNVHAANGKLAGTNTVTRDYDGCVIHEHYDTGRGYSGESSNIYDASRKVWHQTWVDSSGLLLTLEGGLRDGKMILEGETTGPDGKVTKQRITWTPHADGSVQQRWDSKAPGAGWAIVFDGKYTSK